MTSGRSVTAILAELADVERHLVDSPPHSATGSREDLERRRDRLRRELAAVRAAGRTGSRR